MKTAALLVALAANAYAYPHISEAIAERSGEAYEDAVARIEAQIEGAQKLVKRQQKGGFHEPDPGFNAKEQYVSTSGKHRFIPPNFDAGDVRGPCPGLNALANHGYLPRNGVGGHVDFITGTFEGVGMAPDLSGFLTVLGASIDGDGLQWSIGGESKYLPGLPPLLGTPQGISGSHNKYEGDVSPGRGDLYKFGNDYTLQMPQFEHLYKMAKANGGHISLDVMREFRSKRFANSVATNPYLFLGPFTGVLVAPAAFEFIYRFMSNKSAEHPHGRLTPEVLMDFYAVKKDKHGKLYQMPGHERLPENWYKRAISDSYTIPFLNADTVVAATAYPKFLTIGGNLGKVNTLTGVTPNDVMEGAGSAQDLLKGNNLACFAMEFAVQSAPDLIKCSSVIGDIEKQMLQLTKQLSKSTSKLECPKLGKPNTKQFSKFPGYSKLNCKTGNYAGPA